MLVGHDPMSCIKPEGLARRLDQAAINTGAAPDRNAWKLPVSAAGTTSFSQPSPFTIGAGDAASAAAGLPPASSGYCSGWGGNILPSAIFGGGSFGTGGLLAP